MIKNSVDRGFWNALKDIPQVPRNDGPFRVLFVCRDLRDQKKVDWELLRAVSHLPEVQLTVVGDNAPTTLCDAIHLPAISDRTALARLYSKHDALVFSSTVDYYPLTLAEAISAGLVIVAIDSPAAREFRSEFAVTRCATPREIITTLSAISRSSPTILPAHQPDPFFAPRRMLNEYLALYARLLEAS